MFNVLNYKLQIASAAQSLSLYFFKVCQFSSMPELYAMWHENSNSLFLTKQWKICCNETVLLSLIWYQEIKKLTSYSYDMCILYEMAGRQVSVTRAINVVVQSTLRRSDNIQHSLRRLVSAHHCCGRTTWRVSNLGAQNQVALGQRKFLISCEI